MSDLTNEPRPPLEDLRVERAQLALIDYRGSDIGGMTVVGMAGWLGRFAVVLENLLEYVSATALPEPTPQRRAHALVGDLVARGEREGLPVVDWNIATHGLVTVVCYDRVQGERRATFEAWVQALDLGLWPETSRRGVTRLQAIREDYDGYGTDLTLLADIYPKDL